ncbi:hypothetical protein FKW77_007861 [Venturia effusa]|uniref:Uncharacterized protein n=1 Tax=Venturia effusa TaxID=50376 RepID=A0A517L1P1_9PEZI|nr:hypothetical protein FKW77_007861 [Venturia effusa]
MAPTIPNDLVLYHYTNSPYARRIVWYLTLRRIDFAQCMQPHILPRPDLDALSVSYRRIPILSHGKDVYCDTRLILKKLEAAFPHNALGASTPEHLALERLLEQWTTDAGVFMRAVQLMPRTPLTQDPAFIKDRDGFAGGTGSFNAEAMKRARPEATVYIRDAFELLESTFFSDGRQWIFGGAKPSLGDVEAIWPFHWLVDMRGALSESAISPNQFPRVFAWIDRFKDELKRAKASGFKATSVTGAEVMEYMQSARFVDSAGCVDINDPTGLRAGDEVEMWPIDTGSSHRDRGTLVTLTPHEMAVAKKTKIGDQEIHVHMPRWGFRIAKARAVEVKL